MAKEKLTKMVIGNGHENHVWDRQVLNLQY